MTPAEKAKYLIDKFHNMGDLFPVTTYPHAKQCALIAVEEIIAQLDEMIKPEYVSFWHGSNAGETEDGYFIKEYWEEVKTEIEKL